MTATDAYPRREAPPRVFTPSCVRCHTRFAPLAEWWRTGARRWICRNQTACRGRQTRARRARKGTR